MYICSFLPKTLLRLSATVTSTLVNVQMQAYVVIYDWGDEHSKCGDTNCHGYLFLIHTLHAYVHTYIRTYVCVLCLYTYVRMYAFVLYARIYVCTHVCTLYFHSRPMINQKYEEKTCGEGPNLTVVLEDDQCLVDLCNSCLVSDVQQVEHYSPNTMCTRKLQQNMYVRTIYMYVCTYIHTFMYVRMYIQCHAIHACVFTYPSCAYV